MVRVNARPNRREIEVRASSTNLEVEAPLGELCHVPPLIGRAPMEFAIVDLDCERVCGLPGLCFPPLGNNLLCLRRQLDCVRHPESRPLRRKKEGCEVRPVVIVGNFDFFFGRLQAADFGISREDGVNRGASYHRSTAFAQ